MKQINFYVPTLIFIHKLVGCLSDLLHEIIRDYKVIVIISSQKSSLLWTSTAIIFEQVHFLSINCHPVKALMQPQCLSVDQSVKIWYIIQSSNIVRHHTRIQWAERAQFCDCGCYLSVFDDFGVERSGRAVSWSQVTGQILPAWWDYDGCDSETNLWEHKQHNNSTDWLILTIYFISVSLRAPHLQRQK
jgi:hypothetical protein